MYFFDNNTSKIDELAKHTIAENIIRMPTLMYAPGMSEDSVRCGRDSSGVNYGGGDWHR